MKVNNYGVILGDASFISPGYVATQFTDEDGANISILNSTVLRIYEILKVECFNRRQDFEEYVKEIGE